VRLPSVNDDVWTYLAESLLVAEPGELAEIREALAPQQARFGELFWSRARGEERGERLRAAAALAAYDPRGEGWPAIAPAVAGDLVNVPAVHLGDWLAALSPVRRGLVPALMAIFADPARRDVERSLAIDILADYAADDPAVLGELTMTAEPEQFPAVSRQVEARFAAVAPLLEAEIARSLPEELPAADPARETLGIRQAKAAAVLLRFGRPECVWPLFVHSPDPRVRSYLIHFLGPFAVSPEPLAERLAVEPDVSARRALILALGEMVGAGAASEVREADSDRVCARLLPLLRDIFSREPDPGLHAAAEWTLRELGDAKWLTARREAWRDEQGDAAPPRLDAVLREFSGGGPREPRWFVNSQGQSFVAIPGPVEFLMGSPESELGHRADEIHHRRRIARSFAITSKPITKEQVNRLVGYGHWGKALPYIGSDSVSPPDVPRPGQSWLSAAIYCNALSDAEGLPESEWVYEWEREGALHSIRPAQNWRDRSGYRLPTESEWEYATRAGGGTSRFYGETTGLLGKYAWYSKNSGLDALEGHRVARPVGHKKPNDFGIYDALGNVWNWCQDPHAPYPQGARDSAIEDEDAIPVFSRNKSHVLRGGSYENPSRSLRSASRSLAPIQAGGLDYGFRVARTLLPVPMTALPNTGGGGEDVPTRSDLD
jgi:formylglycine-generating enzyme required for sulfatase activity